MVGYWTYLDRRLFPRSDFIPLVLWVGRKTNTVYVVLLGCVIAVLMTCIYCLWAVLARYHFDVKAPEATQRVGVAEPVNRGGKGHSRRGLARISCYTGRLATSVPLLRRSSAGRKCYPALLVPSSGTGRGGNAAWSPSRQLCPLAVGHASQVAVDQRVDGLVDEVRRAVRHAEVAPPVWSLPADSKKRLFMPPVWYLPGLPSESSRSLVVNRVATPPAAQPSTLHIPEGGETSRCNSPIMIVQVVPSRTAARLAEMLGRKMPARSGYCQCSVG